MVSSPTPLRGQTAGKDAKPTVAESIQLEPVKQLRKGVDEWPLIANPGSPAAVRVNATLTGLNLRLAQAVRACNGDVLDAMRGLSTKAATQAITQDWSRSVSVTMAGPRFLSLVATEETDCGGAHPNSDVMALVFDMTTGTPVNWPALLAKTAKASSFVDSVADGSKVGGLVLPALAKINLERASEDCKGAFLKPQSFLVWPDAQSGTLVVQAFDLPHVVQSCADEIGLPMGQARQLGFDESVLTAIEQAHRQVAATPIN